VFPGKKGGGARRGAQFSRPRCGGPPKEAPERETQGGGETNGVAVFYLRPPSPFGGGGKRGFWERVLFAAGGIIVGGAHPGGGPLVGGGKNTAGGPLSAPGLWCRAPPARGGKNFCGGPFF